MNVAKHECDRPLSEHDQVLLIPLGNKEVISGNSGVSIKYEDNGAYDVTIDKSVDKTIIFDLKNAATTIDLRIRLLNDSCATLLVTQMNELNTQVELDLKVGVTLHSGSSLDLVRFLGRKNSSLKSAYQISVLERAQLKLSDIKLGSAQYSAETQVNLDGEKACVNYYGADELFVGAQNKKYLHICHNAKNTSSFQTFRGVYDDNSLGSFLGKVSVQKNCSGCEAQQLYRAIIVGDNAKAHVLPQLEVNNEDIVASHGASIGELDTNALFYLESRGIDREQGKKMLLSSFLMDALGTVQNESIKNIIFKDIKNIISDSRMGL